MSIAGSNVGFFHAFFFTIRTHGIPKSLRVRLDNGGFIVQNLLILSHNSKKFRLMARYETFFVFLPR